MINSCLTVAGESIPLFNTPNIGEQFGKNATKGLHFDKVRLLRALEAIALEGMELRIEKEHVIPGVHQVSAPWYANVKPLYIAEGFTLEGVTAFQKANLNRERLLESLYSFPRCMYIWGGNDSKGIEKMYHLFPVERDDLSPFERNYWGLKGVDCSGLLFEVTGGQIPRNTSELLQFGVAVDLSDVKPLDLLIWPGHMVIVLEGGKVIESRHEDGGVIMRDLKERLEMIHEERRFVKKLSRNADREYMIRRWL